VIVRLIGNLIEVNEDSVVVELDGIAREVLVPAYAIGELTPERGRQVTLHTLEFLEGTPTSGYLTPLLIGFVSAEDKLFFERFIAVKGIGVRRALKALNEPTRRVATWIQEGDVKALARLKGIGPRAAQQIVVDLKGKIADFALPPGADGGEVVSALTDAQHDALTILIEWGDSRADAERYIQQAARLHPEIESPDEWVRAAYRVRSRAE